MTNRHSIPEVMLDIDWLIHDNSWMINYQLYHFLINNGGHSSVFCISSVFQEPQVDWYRPTEEIPKMRQCPLVF